MTAPAAAPRIVHALADIAVGATIRFRFADRVVEGVVAGPVRRICAALGPGALSLPVTYRRVTLGITAADLVDPVVATRRPAPSRAAARPRQGSLL